METRLQVSEDNKQTRGQTDRIVRLSRSNHSLEPSISFRNQTAALSSRNLIQPFTTLFVAVRHVEGLLCIL